MLSATGHRSVLRTFRALNLAETRRHSSQVLCDLERDGRVAVLTLNSPTKLNALSEEMGDELTAHVARLKGDSSTRKNLRCCVITGAGKAFSAGGDLGFLIDRHNDEPANNIRIMKAFYKRFLCLRQLPVPVIGAINGPAVGAGFCLGTYGYRSHYSS